MPWALVCPPPREGAEFGRGWEYRLEDYEKNTAERLFGGEWNNVTDCDFWMSDIAATEPWITKRCNFYLCRPSGEGKYEAKQDWSVVLGLVDEEKPFVEDLTSRHSTTSRGNVYFKFQRPFMRRMPSPLWRWADGAM